MTDVVAIQSLAVPAGEDDDYIQRFTFPQSGEVKGCYVTTNATDGYDTTGTFGTSLSHGFSDGTQDYALSGAIRNSSRESKTRFVNDRVLVSLDYTTPSVVNMEAEVDSLGLIAGTNDGYVDLKWLTAPSSGDTRIVTIQCYAGSGVSCVALEAETGPLLNDEVFVNFGFKPNFGFSLTNYNSNMVGVGVLPSTDPLATATRLTCCLGFYDDNLDGGVPNQKMVMWQHDTGTGNVACGVENLACANIASAGGGVYRGQGAQIVDVVATGFDLKTVELTASEAGVSNIALLGVSLGNASATVSHETTPTSTGAGTWGQTARTQSLMVLSTRVAAVGTSEIDFDAGPFGWSLLDRNSQVSYAVGFDDGGTTAFARASQDKLAVLPLDDGTLGTDHFDVDFTSFDGHSAFNTSFNFAATDTSTARIWPTLHIQNDNPANFDAAPASVQANGKEINFGNSSIEYFEGGSAGTLLNAVTANSGTLSIDQDEGLGTIDCSGDPVTFNDSAYWYYKLQLDKTKTWAVRATIRFESGSTLSHPDVFSIVNGAEPIASLPYGLSVFQKRIQCGLVEDGTASARVGYFPGGGTALGGIDPNYGNGSFWDGATESWTAPALDELSPNAADIVSVRMGATEDFYTFTIFNRGDTEQFCILVQNSADATAIDDDRQGEIAHQTDWVSWSTFSASTDSLWVILGDRYTNIGASKYQVHMFEVDQGADAPRRALVNCKDALADDYDVREVVGADKVWVLAERDGIAFADTEAYGDEGIRKRSWIKDDDGTDYLFYEAFDIGGAYGPRGDPAAPPADGETRIKMVSSTDGGVTWSSPTTLIDPGVDVGTPATYQVVTGLQVLKYNQHPTPAERCMMFLTVEVATSAQGEHRMFVFTAANLSDTTWTQKNGSDTDNSIFAGVVDDTAYNHSGHGDPVVSGTGGAWHMMLSSLHAPASPTALNPVQGWQISHAESTDAGTPVSWTIDVGPPVAPHIASTAEGIRTYSAFSGTTIDVSEGVNDKHQVVLFRKESGGSPPADDYVVARIRKRLSSTQIALLQEPVGLGLGDDSSMAVIGTGSITPHTTRVLSSGDIELIGTAFQPFIRGVDLTSGPGPVSLGNAEFTMRWTSPDWVNWTPDYDHSPVAIITTKVGRNIENFSVRQDTLGVPTEILVTPIPTIDLSRSTVSIPGGLDLLPIEDVSDESLLGWTTQGIRYTYSDDYADQMFGWTTTMVIDAPIQYELVTMDESASAVTIPGGLTLEPEQPPLPFDSVLNVDESGSAVSIIGALALVPEAEPDDIPVLRMKSGSTVGAFWLLEFADDLNARVTESGSCVVADVELVPICGKIEDVCQPICVLDIKNGALAMLGLPLQTDEAATNKYMTRVNLSWRRIRKEVLREGMFNGSIDKRDLVQISGGADHRGDYAYAYELPNCFLRAIEINGVKAAQAGPDLYTLATSYERNREVLYSDESTVQLQYVMDVSDINQLKSDAHTALIYKLALDMAPSFKDADEIAQLRQSYNEEVLEARSTDSQETSPTEFVDYTEDLWMKS